MAILTFLNLPQLISREITVTKYFWVSENEFLIFQESFVIRLKTVLMKYFVKSTLTFIQLEWKLEESKTSIISTAPRFFLIQMWQDLLTFHEKRILKTITDMFLIFKPIWHLLWQF